MVNVNGTKVSPRQKARTVVAKALEGLNWQDLDQDFADLTSREVALVDQQVKSVVHMLLKKLGMAASNGHATDTDEPTVSP